MAKQSEPEKNTVPTKELYLPVPWLLDAVRYLVELGAILFALIIFVISLLNGLKPFAAGTRAATALFAIGLLGWVAIYLLANLFLWLLNTLKPKEKEETPASGSQSREA
ncbi:MAG: hypothetical protein HYZ49_21165 [Chloroflexi bacterium]|nr:hypothetical protein [Chloroflexota bacterium]